jgi:hypothetical protein
MLTWFRAGLVLDLSEGLPPVEIPPPRPSPDIAGNLVHSHAAVEVPVASTLNATVAEPLTRCTREVAPWPPEKDAEAGEEREGES